MHHRLLPLLLAGLLISGVIPVFGQTAVDSGLPLPGDRRLPSPVFQQPPTHPRFTLPDIPPAVETGTGEVVSGPRFVLRDVTFTGNTVVQDAALRVIAEPYLDKSITAVELERLRLALTAHYVALGYVNSGALLPDQAVNSGIVRFEIVEGELSTIEIRGNQRLRRSYFVDRIKRGAGTPLNINALQKQVQILVQSGHIKALNARLGPGKSAGEAALSVDVRESDPVSLGVAYGNGRAPSIGGTGIDIDAALRDVLGTGDEYSVSFGYAHGARDYEATAELPLGNDDLHALVSFQGTDSKVVEVPFVATNVRSESAGWRVALSYALLHEPEALFELGLELGRRDSQTFLLGSPFAFSPGVKADGKSAVAPLRLSQSYTLRRRNQVFAARSVFSFGLDLLGATRNAEPLPDGRFSAWQGQLRYVQRDPDSGWQVLLRAQAQFTQDRLLPIEKFAVGGFETVRGYRENQVVRDNGFATSVEFRVPAFRIPAPLLSRTDNDGQVELAPFFDFGRSWNTDVPSADPTTLVSAGLGMRWRVSAGVNAQLYYAYRLRATPAPADRNLQDDGIHFRINAALF